MADFRKATSQAMGQSVPLVPPLQQSSVYTLPDLDALDRIANAEEPGFIYARDGHPNARQLADELAIIEGAGWALICGSGMAAISACILSVVKQGDRLLASDKLYGRTTQLFSQELVRFGVHTACIDCNDLDAVQAALQTPTRILFVETLSNPLLRLVDLQALVKVAHAQGCLVAVDNTFATPLLTKPLDLGADLVIESLTKMIGGHGDVTLGLVAGPAEGASEMLQQVSQVSSIWGFAANPFDCWLASRGLATLALRMRTATTSAAAIADWLAEQPGVARVVYPGRRDHPDHLLAQRTLIGGFGNMLCFELAGGRAAANHFMRHAPGIPFSPSLGSTTTTCSHPGDTSHRYVSPAEKKRQGISDGMIRLSVGIEELQVIQDELAKGLR